MMCRPILKHQNDLRGIQNILKKQAKEGLSLFGLGTDTAPHLSEKKYCECGACGVYSAPIALELYAMAFEEMGILDHLQTFACDVMPEFYGIKDKLPSRRMTLQKEPRLVLSSYDEIVTPFSGQIISWSAY
jgi:dihydroorotase